MRTLILSVGILFIGTLTADADKIIIDGKMYSDVLIYESGSYYYVKKPREGKSLSVRKSDVPDNQVQINEDPYYREQLRDLYDDVKLRGAEAALKDREAEGSAFVDDTSAEVTDSSALFAGGGGAGGKAMNLTIAQVKQAFTSAGITLAGSGGTLSGSSADGVLSVKVFTAGDSVTAVNGSINSTDQAQVQQKVLPIMMLAGKVAPWANQWIVSSMGQLMSTGKIHKSQGGVSISLGVTATGLGFSIKGQ
jgi:hypothetical protein